MLSSRWLGINLMFEYTRIDGSLDTNRIVARMYTYINRAAGRLKLQLH